MYSKQLQVYRGIDNVLDFRLVNADQKPVDITSYTPKFVAFDENNIMVLEKDGTVLDDGSSITKGKFSVSVTENDLLNVKQQYLNYNIFLQETNGNKVLTYSHSNFDNNSTIYVNARAFPGPQATYSITQFQKQAVGVDLWNSETVDAQPAINGNEALHTAAVYTLNYVGSVTVQATLDNQVNESTQWADIASLYFTGNETTPVPVNFNGVFSYIRFRTDSDPDNKIVKVLVRN